MTGVAVGRAGYGAAKHSDTSIPGYGALELLTSCVIGSIGIAFVLIGAAVLVD
jgi:hypothetical protein